MKRPVEGSFALEVCAPFASAPDAAHPACARDRHRRGLAPLELVLSLPLLLMVMALMINFGTAASWKVRAANAARDAVWSNRWPRSGATPWPMAWPQNAGRGTAGGPSLATLAVASIDQPVARGPMLGQMQVYRNLLDPTRGLQLGTSSISRQAPLMPRPGQIRYNLQQPLLDDGWQYPRMGMGSNFQRRAPIIYNLPQTNQNMVQQYINAVVAVYEAPFQPQLAPLDRDADALAFFGGAPDFHPRLGGFCSLEKKTVHDQYVLPLVDRIQSKKGPPKIPGVPENMTRYFINMYKQEIKLLKAQQAAGTAGPGAQSQINTFQSYVDTLTSFLGTL